MRVSVVVPRDRVEEATAGMLELHPEGFVEQPAGEAVELVAFTDEAGAGRLRERFGAVTSSPVAPGWEEEWKRFHVPAVVGSLWIGPPGAEAPPELTAVVIDPGQAFGTGAHPTTRLCLEFLLGLERGSVLDVGCGSGVLAIAAAKLGFGPVVAIDTDPAAIEAARTNAAVNRADVEVRPADVRSDRLGAVDIVLANLDLPTLGSLGRKLDSQVVVTSGYGEADCPALRGFTPVARRTRENWAADLFARE